MLNHKISPTFIVSSGRSGTTLLRGILNASSQIHIPHESDFLARAYPFYQNKKELNEADYASVIELFKMASQENGWGMDEVYLLNQLKAEKPQTFSQLNEAIYEAYMSKEGLSHLSWGIKHPVLIASIDRIFDVFPDARVVHIVRDGRDVCLSYQDVHANSPQKFGPNSPLTAALYWIDGLRRVQERTQKKTKQKDSSRIYELRYEDLLTEPEVSLALLCAFLNIDFTPDLYQNYQNSENNKKLLLAQHSNTIHAKVKNGIDASNQHKFLNKMPRLHRFIFELVTLPYLKKYNYFIEFPQLSTPLLQPLRMGLYTFARFYNNWRYHKRDLSMFERSQKS